MALTDLSVRVSPSQVVVLLGENGAGKSTLLRLLLTTVALDAGEAWVAGHSVREDTLAVRRASGFVLGSERTWEWRLSGRENLRFFAALHGLDGEPARARVDAVLHDVALEDAADRNVGTYSTGMRLRLALARALLHEPSVLLLDEPTHALDPVATAAFHDLLHRLVDRHGTAVLLATHDLQEATEVADEVLVLERGHVRARRSPPFSAAELSALLGAGAAADPAS